jgi:hypothetical protein
MSSCPLQVNRQDSREPLKVCSIGAQVELTVRDAGEKVAARSATSWAVRHLEDSCGGPITPPVWVLLITCHRPGSIPSANPGEPPKAHARANPHTICEANRGNCALALRFRIISPAQPLL